MHFAVPVNFVVCLCLCVGVLLAEQNEENVKVFTVASEATDGYNRFLRSANYYNIEVETLGMGSAWLGGDMSMPGGGYKVNLLKKALEPFQDDHKTIVLFTDSYDVIFTTSVSEIVKKFEATGAKLLFGAEPFCWPDKSLEKLYPEVAVGEVPFLNSGMFIGYADNLYDVLKTTIKDTDDDQLFYTRAFLDTNVRERNNIKLDHKSNVFQNLNGAMDQVKMEFEDGEAIIYNVLTQSKPNVLHGNGPSKLYLNNFGNYLAGAFIDDKCQLCDHGNYMLKEDALPIITLAIFIEKPMPFMEEFFDSILAIDYPRKKLSLFMHNTVEYHSEVVSAFIDKFGGDFLNVKTILPNDNIDEASARNLAVSYSVMKESDYLFVVDAEVHIDNAQTLRELLRLNKPFISPTISRTGGVWSNFWGALTEEGYYARSHDYMDIVKGNSRGLWNVPYTSSCYLVKKSIFSKLSYTDELLDADMALCKNLRKENVFMNTLNLEHYGHLIDNDSFNSSLTRPDMYMLFSNQADWEQRYIHPDYAELLKENVTHKQPCPDVYWFPIVTDQFCDDLVAIMENFGKWSDGSTSDTRIKGGYEAVPTRDIHMSQVGLEKLWLKFLQMYVRPLQEAVYLGYFHNPPHAIMNFVVRYKPTEQPFLRPHHDSSTFTINIALNRPNIDYEGGGCKFLRYNCSVTDTKKGWMLMHPGRLTHYHEGLRTTKGTRYIMISFVNP